jgi:hypothetical protein
MKSCQRGTGADEPQQNIYSLFPQVEFDFSDKGLKFCGAISGRASFFVSTLFVLHQDNKTSPTN